MRVRAADNFGRVLWVEIPDDCAGELLRGTLLRDVIRRRARIVRSIQQALHGADWWAVVRKTYKIKMDQMKRLELKGVGDPEVLDRLEFAFHNSVKRVRVAASRYVKVET